MYAVASPLPGARKVSSERKRHRDGCRGHRIFGAEEIQEALLLLGPDGMRPFPLAQRVNKIFNGSLPTATVLSGGLCFRPDPSIIKPMIHFLICEAFHALLMSESKEAWSFSSCPAEKLAMRCRRTPRCEQKDRLSIRRKAFEQKSKLKISCKKLS